jgi:hypothetical protein
LASIATVAGLLELGEFDRRLIQVVAAFQRLPRLVTLRLRFINSGLDFIGLAGQLAGAPAAEAAPKRSRSAC